MTAGREGRARRRRTTILSAALGALVSLALLTSCSILLDWTGFTDGLRGDAGDGGHGDSTLDDEADAPVEDVAPEIDAPVLTVCGADKLCSPLVPGTGGWSGPYALLRGDAGSLPACDPSVYKATPAFEGTGGLDAGPSQCGCTCSTPAVTCDPPTVTFYADTTCTTACAPAVSLSGCVPTVCSNLAVAATNLVISTPTPSAGIRCAPDASVSTPRATWTVSARVCALAEGTSSVGCNPNQYCLPATSPFCILATGDVACPAGGEYPFRHVYYQGASDQRGCSPCACAAPVGSACSLPLIPTVFSYNPGTPGCAIPTGQPYFAPVPCTGKLTTVGGLMLQADASVSDSGACAPSSVSPTGVAVPTSPTTLCCTSE
jgi:hypothetical protein